MGAQVSSAEGKPKAADAEHKPPITPPSTVVKTTPTTLAAPKAVSKDNHLILESPGTHVVSVGKETGPNTIESKSQLQVEVTKERDAKLLDSEGEEEGGPAETKGQALPVAQKLPVALPQKPLEPSHVQKKKPKLAKKAAKRKHVAHPSVVHKFTDKELRRLRKRYDEMLRIDTDKKRRPRRRPFEDDGETSLSVGTFCMMPELAFNPFIPRVCSVVTRRLRDSTPSTPKMQHIPLSIPEENYVSYDVYIAVLHILSDRVPGAEKAQLSFEVFDVADEGELDVMDMLAAFRASFPYMPLDEVLHHADIAIEACSGNPHSELPVVTLGDYKRTFDYAGFDSYFTIPL